MLRNGRWTENWQPIQAKDKDGRFVRQLSSFRETDVQAVAGRYHLYVALICPWAHRTLITRKLKGLEQVIGVTVVEPFLTDQGWKFGHYAGSQPDPLFAATYLHQIYTRADNAYTGRATVPVLWDKQRKTIVNNESAEIVRIFDSGFDKLASGPELYPASLRTEINGLNDLLYHQLNNGVYKAGFASSQVAYNEAVTGVFRMLDALEARMADGRAFLLGDKLTESDIRLYVTLIRFDTAYHGLFKCNLRRIVDYEYLQAWLERLYAIPAFGETTNIRHIKEGYYSIKTLNPSGNTPMGPQMAWMAA